MKIVHCPKGGRVPEGYCRDSCLNYPGNTKKKKALFIGKIAKKMSNIDKHVIDFIDDRIGKIRLRVDHRRGPCCPK